MEESAQEKEREIIVHAPYIFDSLAKILRREGVIVKNNWPSIKPSQGDLDSVIAAIEGAYERMMEK